MKFTCRALVSKPLVLSRRFNRLSFFLGLITYLLITGIIHRLLCYQKKSRTKISYDWRQLWGAFFTVLKFLISNEASLLKKFDIFQLALQIVNMVNLFITYGDTFLLTAASYDELYYEVIRCQQTFECLYSLSK